MPDEPSKPHPHPLMGARPTVRLDPNSMKPSWSIVMAMLEQLSDWSTFALRLGTLALIQECVRDLAQRDASIATFNRLRELVEVLGQMPIEAK